MVFLQVDEFLAAGEIFQNTLQLARLAGAQPQLEHQFAQAESSLRILLEEFEDFLRRGKFAHRVSLASVPLQAHADLLICPLPIRPELMTAALHPTPMEVEQCTPLQVRPEIQVV